MRTLGFIALVIGFLGLVATLQIDTSVATETLGQRVHNIGLMNEKQNRLLFFAVFAVVGVLVATLGRKGQNPVQDDLAAQASTDVATKTCPFCAERIKAEAVVCRFCQRDLPAPAQASLAENSVDGYERIEAMGGCPNCASDVPLTAEECPSCKAQFGPSSAWKIVRR